MTLPYSSIAFIRIMKASLQALNRICENPTIYNPERIRNAVLEMKLDLWDVDALVDVDMVSVSKDGRLTRHSDNKLER